LRRQVPDLSNLELIGPEGRPDVYLLDHPLIFQNGIPSHFPSYVNHIERAHIRKAGTLGAILRNLRAFVDVKHPPDIGVAAADAYAARVLIDGLYFAEELMAVIALGPRNLADTQGKREYGRIHGGVPFLFVETSRAR